jgi:hypothetical protein
MTLRAITLAAMAAITPAIAAPAAFASGASASHHVSKPRATIVVRDGRIKRSREAEDAFKREHPCPSTGKASGDCHGYVVDHVIPLNRGGADAPSNMQWMTIQDAKAKDKAE